MIFIPLWEVIAAKETEPRVMRDRLEDGEAVMDDKLRAAVHHLLCVWKQYNSMHGTGDGENEFSHACMSAGEAASQFLEELGLGHDQGWQFVANDKAIALMDCEFSHSGDLYGYGGAGVWDEGVLGPAPPHPALDMKTLCKFIVGEIHNHHGKSMDVLAMHASDDDAKSGTVYIVGKDARVDSVQRVARNFAPKEFDLVFLDDGERL